MSTKQHINAIKDFFPEITSLLEVQCGGGYDIENCLALQDKGLHYIGVDVVDEHILDNRQYFRTEKNKIFMVLDASNEPLPKADIIVAVGMAPYLPIANIWSLLENIRDSEARYFAFDYYHTDKELNAEIQLSEEGDKNKNTKSKSRAINLCQAPFYFPQPKFLIATPDIHKSVAFYEIDKLSYFMDWHNDDISKLRSQIFEIMEKDFKFLEEFFLKEASGKEMFKEMMAKFLEVDAGTHNQKYYFDEPYKTIIDRHAGLNIRNNFFRLIYRCEAEVLKNSGYYFINDENFTHAQILAKDYIRFKLGLPMYID